MTMTTPQEVIDVARAISNKLKPMLVGQPSELQGAVLADLLSIFIVGHHPKLRKEVLDLHIEMVHQLIEVNQHLIFPNGLPDGWEED